MSMLTAIGSYDDIWKAIISPTRQDYHVYDLGPTDITVQGNLIRRTDFRLLNKRGFSIQCSYFQQVNIDKAIPCVVYLHANGCSRLEALQYLDTVLSNPVSFFCFDFSGCGKSDGNFTSVGWYEQDDLECVIQYLLNTGKVSKIAVWGRSMGAATALMYASKDPRVSCLVFDSPFCTFKKLVKELVKKKAPIPDFLVTGALQIIRTTIQKKAGFDIDALRPIKYVDKISVPALFGAAKDDNFVSNQHTQDLYQAFGGHKQLMLFDGDHNTLRPPAWTKLVKEFLRFHLLGERHESQIPKKSIKNLFSTAEELPQPNVSQLGSNQKSQKYFDVGRPAPISTTTQAAPKQSHMNFSWLNNGNNGASSPALSVSHTPQSSGIPSKFTEKYGADIKPENYHHHKSIPSEKKLNGLFTPHVPADPVHHHRSVQNYYESASPVNHARQTPDSPRSMTRGYFSQAHMKSLDQPTKASNTSSKSISEIQSNASFFTVKENKPKGTSGFDPSLNYFNGPKNSVSLKDASNYHLNNTADTHLQAQKSKRKIFGPDSHQARGPQSSSIPRAMISLDLANKKNSDPLSNPPQRSQRDRSKRIFGEKSVEAQSNSGHAARPASSNSFTRLNPAVPEPKISKGTPLANEMSKKAMLLDVSNIAPYGAHNTSNYNSNYSHNSAASMGYLDVRRISDNYSHYSQFEEPKRKDHTAFVPKNGTRY